MVNIEELKQSFNNRGYSFNIFVDPPGQQWLGFTHTVDEIVVVLEGSVTITVAGKTLTPSIGDEVFIPAHAIHDLITNHDAGSQWAYGYLNR